MLNNEPHLKKQKQASSSRKISQITNMSIFI